MNLLLAFTTVRRGCQHTHHEARNSGGRCRSGYPYPLLAAADGKERSSDASWPSNGAYPWQFAPSSHDRAVQTVSAYIYQRQGMAFLILVARFLVWSKEYGGVFSLKFGNDNVIVLCDKKAIHELIDKKGLNYVDRPPSYVGNLLTHGDHMVVSPYDPLTAAKRRVATHNLSVSSITHACPWLCLYSVMLVYSNSISSRESSTTSLPPFKSQSKCPPRTGPHVRSRLLILSRITQLMFDFLDDPDHFYEHVRRVTSSIACTFVYGHRASTYDSFWGRVSPAFRRPRGDIPSLT
jgi:hypothetical protein